MVAGNAYDNDVDDVRKCLNLKHSACLLLGVIFPRHRPAAEPWNCTNIFKMYIYIKVLSILL